MTISSARIGIYFINQLLYRRFAVTGNGMREYELQQQQIYN